MNSTLLALNRWAEPALALAWPMLWQSSLLIAFLLALDFALHRKLRASVRYALWLIVLVKLALPPSLALPTGLGWWLRPAAAAPARPRQVAMVVTYGPARAVQPLALIPLARVARPPARLSAMAWGLLVSGAVSLGLLAWMLVRWRQVAREARRAAPAPERLEELFLQARLLSGLRRPPRLRLIERPMSPAVCGLFGPVILLPRALAEELPPDQLRAVLLHELVHLRRGDLWLSLVQALFQILYWWHPLLWLANARIRRAREEAVDDAVMLALEDNAEAYAPTLLQVARLALCRPPVSLGLVGILESRTFLRQRIERLLDFRPPRKAGLTLASVFSLAAFAALALPMGQAPAPAQKPEPAAATEPASVPPVPPSAPTTVSEKDRFKSKMLLQDGKLLYEMGKVDESEAKLKEAKLLDPLNGAVDYYLNLVRDARSSKAATPSEEHSSSKRRAAQLVQDGKLLYEMGKLDEAEAKLKLARKEDPENDAAYYYLNLVSEARYHTAINERDSLSKTNLWARTNVIFTGRGRQIIVSKLDRIRLAEVKPMDNVPLSEVIRYLDQEARKSDPEGRGINFLSVIDPNNTDPATLLPIAAPGAEPAETNTIRIPHIPALHDVRLADFLEILVTVTDKPIEYSIEDYGVVFSPKGRETTPLYFRTIKLDPNTFETGMRHFLGLPERGNGPEKLGTMIRQFFAEAGVDISPPKNMFYSDRSGTLLVYATLADLDIIERAVQVLNTAPPQLNTEAVFIGSNVLISARPPSTAPPQLNIEAVFIELPKAEVEAFFWEKFDPANGPPPAGSVKTATLTHSQAEAQLDRWKSMGSTNILGHVQITTLSGRQAQVSVVDTLRITATDEKGQAKTETMPLGPMLGVTPRATDEGPDVQMDLNSRILEFLGYDAPGPFVLQLQRAGDTNAAPINATLPLPHFRIRQVATTVEVQDGQTVVLGGFGTRHIYESTGLTPLLRGEPIAGSLSQDQPDQPNEKEIIVLVTPTIVDPAGNRIYPEKNR
jgi:beta-lactamase regulating signal transducer with metallopeptidase domain